MNEGITISMQVFLLLLGEEGLFALLDEGERIDWDLAGCGKTEIP